MSVRIGINGFGRIGRLALVNEIRWLQLVILVVGVSCIAGGPFLPSSSDVPVSFSLKLYDFGVDVTGSTGDLISTFGLILVSLSAFLMIRSKWLR